MEIRLSHICKSYGAVKALSDVSLTVADGELFFLLGPSGCGKTTLLRLIGGFEQPTSGEVFLGGKASAGLPASQRNTAMVFQGYALWPHMTVRQNVAFGLQTKGVPRDECRRRVDKVLEEMQISELADRRPQQLSGGQQQRVALARTLVVQPGCLLLDEPLANLDAKLRRDMRLEIRRVCKENHLTAVYVTHDRAEALSMADRLAVFDRGRLVQVGAPEEVYRRPINAFTANFLGESNILEGTVQERTADGGGVIASGAVMLRTARLPEGVAAGSAVQVSIRPEALRLLPADAPEGEGFSVTLKHIDYLGEIADHIGETADGRPVKFFELNPRNCASAGASVRLAVSPEDVVCLEGTR